MTLEKFRVNHSRLVEHYQFIEHNLEEYMLRSVENTFTVDFLM